MIKLAMFHVSWRTSFTLLFNVGVCGCTGIQTGSYASKMTPRGLTPFSGPTRSGLHGKCQISPFWGSTFSSINSKYAKKVQINRKFGAYWWVFLMILVIMCLFSPHHHAEQYLRSILSRETPLYLHVKLLTSILRIKFCGHVQATFSSPR